MSDDPAVRDAKYDAKARDGFRCQAAGHWPRTLLVAQALAEAVGIPRTEWRRFEVEACAGVLDPSHTIPVSRAPSRVADPENILAVCRRHHDAIHAHPLISQYLGLMGHEGDVVRAGWARCPICRAPYKEDPAHSCLPHNPGPPGLFANV